MHYGVLGRDSQGLKRVATRSSLRIHVLRFRTKWCIQATPSKFREVTISQFTGRRSIRFSQPAELPGNRKVLIVATKADIGSVAVTEFQRLVGLQRDRRGHTDTRVHLFGE